MSYCRAVDYLASKTSVIELCNQSGGRVAVCPEWNGRVFISSCNGPDGESFGYINIAAIDNDDRESFGGEDLWTVSPAVRSFQVQSVAENEIQLRHVSQISDANGSPVYAALSRTAAFLPQKEIGSIFGETVLKAVEQDEAAFVCFYTENRVQSEETAVLASRLQGIYNAGKHTAVLFPHLPKEPAASDSGIITGSGTGLESGFDIDFRGGSPHGRRRRFSRSLLLRADGMGYCRVTKPYTPAALFGAVDFRSGSLTLWAYDLPDPTENDLVRIENHRKTSDSVGYWDLSYEINVFSAAQRRYPPFAAVYRQYTLHISAGNHVLSPLISGLFSVSLEEVTKTILR